MPPFCASIPIAGEHPEDKKKLQERRNDTADDMATIERKRTTGSRKRVSPRGPFEIFTNTKINPPGPRRPVDADKAAEGFEHSALAEKHGDTAFRQAELTAD